MENWTLKNEQEAEIETIKERNISIKLSDADVERLCKKAGGAGLTVPELLVNFIRDLVSGTYSNGSDERMYANEWFDRCWFGMGFEDNNFLQWLISNDCTEEAVTTWNDLQDAKKDLQESLIEDELDEEYADNCKEDISYFQEILNDLFNEYKQQQREIKDSSLENEMEKVLQWYEEMKKMKNLENTKSALQSGAEGTSLVANGTSISNLNFTSILQKSAWDNFQGKLLQGHDLFKIRVFDLCGNYSDPQSEVWPIDETQLDWWIKEVTRGVNNNPESAAGWTAFKWNRDAQEWWSYLPDGVNELKYDTGRRATEKEHSTQIDSVKHINRSEPER